MTDFARRTLVFLAAALWLGAAAADAAVFHDIEVDLQPASGELRIVDRVRPGARDQYRFRLAPWLEIERLSVDGAALAPVRQDGFYRVDLDPGAAAELLFERRGRVPPRAAASLASGGGDGVFLPGYAGWIPVG